MFQGLKPFTILQTELVHIPHKLLHVLLLVLRLEQKLVNIPPLGCIDFLHHWLPVVHELLYFVELLFEVFVFVLLRVGGFEAQEFLELLEQLAEGKLDRKIFQQVIKYQIDSFEGLLGDLFINKFKIVPAFQELLISDVLLNECNEIIKLNINAFHVLYKTISLFLCNLFLERRISRQSITQSVKAIFIFFNML